VGAVLLTLGLQMAAIEPVIGNSKTDHQLNRNYYRGIKGDHITKLLADA